MHVDIELSELYFITRHQTLFWFFLFLKILNFLMRYTYCVKYIFVKSDTFLHLNVSPSLSFFVYTRA